MNYRVITVRLLIVLLIFGCKSVPADFDVIDYISENCNPESNHLFLDVKFSKHQQKIIVDAIYDANYDLGTDIQICGIVDDADRDFIEYGVAHDKPGLVGYHINGLITIYPENWIHCDEHFRKVFLHELGHYLGVGHSDDHNDIMAGGWNFISDYSKNDISNIKSHMPINFLSGSP